MFQAAGTKIFQTICCLRKTRFVPASGFQDT
jgi:hypothetical protein